MAVCRQVFCFLRICLADLSLSRDDCLTKHTMMINDTFDAFVIGLFQFINWCLNLTSCWGNCRTSMYFVIFISWYYLYANCIRMQSGLFLLITNCTDRLSSNDATIQRSYREGTPTMMELNSLGMTKSSVWYHLWVTLLRCSVNSYELRHHTYCSHWSVNHQWLYYQCWPGRDFAVNIFHRTNFLLGVSKK